MRTRVSVARAVHLQQIQAGGDDMPAALSKDELLTVLKSTAKEHGMHCRPIDHEGLRADLETTYARWIFGGRKVTYHFGCRLEEATHTTRYREAVTDETWGIPAPFFWVEKTTTRGGEVSGTRTECGPGGGGPIEYHRIRLDIEQAARKAGWAFAFERGLRP